MKLEIDEDNSLKMKIKRSTSLHRVESSVILLFDDANRVHTTGAFGN